MSRTTDILEFKESLKEHIDNDTFLFLFEDTSPICISNESLHRLEENEKNQTQVSYNSSILRKLAFTNKIMNILYKNRDGIWINFSLLKIEYGDSTPDLIGAANDPNIYQTFKVSSSKVPEVDFFIDKNNITHYIEKCDGETYNPRKVINIDETNPELVRIEQFSIDNPNLGVTDNHRKQDLKITLLQEKEAKNLVVWLNGVFVEPVYDLTDPKVFYIREAKNVLDTIGLSICDDDHKDYSNIDVINKYTQDNVYYYNINLKIWRWEDVEVSRWNTVRFTKTSKLIYNYIGYDVVTELFFEEDVNPDANMLFLNGQLLHHDEYKVDTHNRKHVYLTKIYNETLSILYELIEKGYDDPYVFLKNIIQNRYFYCISFSEKDGKKILINHVKPIKTGFPDISDVMFRNPRLHDIVLVDGFYLPYVLKRNGIYHYPKNKIDYIPDSSYDAKRKIWKLDICVE